jgi:Galactose oxidase, central domain
MRAPLLLAVLIAGCGADPPPPAEIRLATARAVHTATPLAGEVLIAGGCVTDGCSVATDTTELYDGHSFRPGPRLTGPRDGHTASPLPGGRVLLAGGYAGEGRGALATAEICDTRSCRPTAGLTRPRGGHAAATLDGRVLVTGGTDATTDLYEDSRFRPGPRMRHARAGHTATPLGDGRVLITGGYGPDDRAVAEAELFDGRRFTAAGRLDVARGKHAAVLLPDGRVLVIGGSTDEETRERLASTELWEDGRFTPGPTLVSARYKLPAAAALLPDGRVLVAGDGSPAEIVDVRAGGSRAIPGPVAGAFATATPLGGGRTLVAGGYDDRIAVSDAAFVAVE